MGHPEGKSRMKETGGKWMKNKKMSGFPEDPDICLISHVNYDNQ
jgi:hypothetical protein